MKYNKLFLIFILVVSVLVVTKLSVKQGDNSSTYEDIVVSNDVSTGSQDQAGQQINDEVLAIVDNTPVPLSEKFITQRNLITGQLDKLQRCPDGIDCPIKQHDDPRSASYELGQLVAKQLADYLVLHNKYGVFDDESRELTLNYLTHPDGHVQEQAINLLSVHPVDNQSGLALVSALKDGFDAPIMKQAMQELRRYPEISSEIDTLFQSSMSTGSFFVAREIARNILPFLTEDNIQSYRQLLSTLPPRSKRARYLKANITEFEMRNMSG